MSFSKRKHSFVQKACAVLLAAAMTVSTVLPVLGAQGDTFDKNREVSRRFTSESIVLLRNEENTLPLKGDDQVAVFGSTQVNTQMTVFGSGSTQGIGIGFVDTLSVLKQKTKVDQELENLYRNFARTNPPNTGMVNVDNEILSERSIPEMPLNDSIVSSAASRNDKAVIFIGRTNGEGYDWKLEDEYQLRREEKDMIDLVTKYFDKVSVVLNTASPIDMSWDSDKIDSVLWVGICGDQGANAISSVLSGEVNPSGKLTQTWAASYQDTPTHMNYEMTNYPEGLHGPEIEYEEDIYGGYRYYDTFNVTPKFHFGFGLSYTTFDTQVESVTADSETVTVRASVTNIGDVAGKEVVQVYYSAPDGKLDKAYQQLAGFAKTDLLKPREKQTVTITYRTKDMASYDEENAQYILEQGDYVIRVGNSSRSTHVGAVVSLDGPAVTEQLSNQMQEAIPLERFSKEGVTPYSYEGEAEEIAGAKRIVLAASQIRTVNSASTISDEPELLEGSVESDFVQAAKRELSASKYAASAQAEETAREIPGKIYCADLGVNFAGFVVNDPSGDVDGYKSVTVQKAETQMPFDVDRAYDYEYEISLRYKVQSATSVELRDQNDKTLCTFPLSEVDRWATAAVSGVDLSRVTSLTLVTKGDDINLNWLNFRSEFFAGVVKSSLPSGAYGEPLTVSLYNRDETKGIIRYTTDGSEPNHASPVYSGPIEVSSDMTIKAYAIMGGRADSEMMTAAYTIDAGAVTEKAQKPKVIFLGKDEANNQLVKLSAPAGMNIFYTTDGSEPTTGSALYTGPITAAKGTEIKAVAAGPGYRTSDAAEIRIADVAAPTAGLESLGTYEKGTGMTLSADAGLDIYYTIAKDGSEPQDPTAQSQKYEQPIVFDTAGTTTIKAVAVGSSGTSQTAMFVYNVVDKLYTLEDVYNGDATAEQVVAQMTLSELAEVVANSGRSSRFLSPSVAYADGPLGVKTNNFTKWAAPSLLACSWDEDLFAEQGDAIGREMVEEKIDFWLAPGVNILRDPRSGRNPEYYAEDQVLTGVLASSVIRNVQEHGVGCVIKHFVGNDQETHRKQCANGVVSERALREVYLKAFEIVVKTSQPWGLMTTYCDVNRISTATNFELCTAIPRGEWGYEGIIMTDWGCYADNGMMMYAGNDLIMPSGSAEVIKNAVEHPEQVNTGDPNYTKPTTKAMLQRNVVKIFELMSRTNAFARSIGQEQIYDYQAPSMRWIDTAKDPASTTLSATAAANGAVTPARQEVSVGSPASVTVTPDPGYVVDSVTVTPRAEYDLSGDQLTILSLKSASELAVTFKAVPDSPDFAGLNQLITDAQNKLDSAVIGGKPGNYLHTSADKLSQAIAAARQAAGNTGASALEIEQAMIALKQAVNAFESQVVTQLTHEVVAGRTTKIKAVDHTDASLVIGSENCSDSDGGLNTTGTYKDTFLSYTLDVADTNLYSLVGRISTNEDGCGYEVYVDGELQGKVVKQNKTGGWQNWQTADPLKVPLDAGIHTLKIVFTQSGINVNYFTLEPLLKNVAVTAGENGSVTPRAQQVEMGADAVFQVVPDEGYLADSVAVTPDSSYTLRDNLLTVKRIMGDTAIRVSFKQAPSQPEFEKLGALLKTAQQKADSAVVDGQAGHYTLSTVKAFQREIDRITLIANDSASTVMDVENAIYDINQAIAEFNRGTVTGRTHFVLTGTASKMKATDHVQTSPGIGAEGCQDEDGGQNPIYTDGGTWLSYNIDVDRSGWYSFIPRVSVNTDGAGLRVYIDDTEVCGYLKLQSTGGWQNWVTKDPSPLKLTEGTHTLKIVFAQSGMNVNWFEFEPMANIASAEQPSALTVDYGTAFEALSLPQTVRAALDSGAEADIAVNWDRGNYDGETAGTYTLTGALADTDRINNFSGVTVSIGVTVSPAPVTGPTAQEVADAIVPPVVKTGDTKLALPSVPDGFAIELTASSSPSVLSLDGTIRPQAEDTTVSLTFTVSKGDDTAERTVSVTVPANSAPPTPSGVNTAILEKVVGYAQAQKDSAEYGNVLLSVRRTFETALADAKAVLADGESKQEAVDSAWIALMGEIHKLGFVKGDALALEALYGFAAGLDLSLYQNNQAKAGFPALLAQAKEMLDNRDDCLASELDAMLDSLLAAAEQLRYLPDKSVLGQVLESAKGIDTTLYTAETVLCFNSALEQGTRIFEDENSTQQQVDSAVQTIHRAVSNLIFTPASGQTAGAHAAGDGTTAAAAGVPATGDTALPAAAGALALLAAAVLFKKRGSR